MIYAKRRSAAAGIVPVIGALCALSCSQRPPPAPVSATLLSDPRPLPEVRLTDKTGQEFSSAHLHERFSLLFFGFTHCPDVCPITLKVLADMHRDWKTPHIDAPEVLFVSVDPGRDDPDQIHAYLDYFDPAFQGVTGPRQAMDPWLKALGVSVHVQQSPAGEPYSVTHNSTVYVVGPGAELIALFSPPHEAAMIAADFLKIREHYHRVHSDPSDLATSL